MSFAFRIIVDIVGPNVRWRYLMRLARVAAVSALLVLFAVLKSRAQEEIRQEVPTPSSVDQSITPIERSFEPPPERPALFPRLREELKDAPPFFRDAKIDLNVRSYYLDSTNLDGSKSEAWAGGGALSLQSGYLFDRLSVGTTLYTSQPLYAPLDRDGTLLLQSGQRGYTALGQLYADVKVVDRNYLNLYRHIYDTPYLNQNDNRMTPNTFEGYTFTGSSGGANEEPTVRYGVGYVTKIKNRNSENFISMSRSAGASVDRGVAIADALCSAGPFSIGAIEYYSSDIINIAYGEGKYLTPVFGGIKALVAMQYADQRSVGANLLTGSAFATSQLGVKAEMSRSNGIVTFAYSIAGDGANLQDPWSGNPSYTGAMVQSFNHAGEQAALVEASHDFSLIGFKGVTAYALFAHGWAGATAPGTPPLTRENEIDLDLQWRPQWNGLNGVWLRGRYGYAKVDQGTQTSTRELRFILNYDVAFF